LDDSLGAGRTLHGCRIGRAPSSKGEYGTGTLMIAPEGANRASNRQKSTR
jgi:hypothetical protein